MFYNIPIYNLSVYLYRLLLKVWFVGVNIEFLHWKIRDKSPNSDHPRVGYKAHWQKSGDSVAFLSSSCKWL